jgi:protocatechuate 3,4-dioxygenase beta subunit
VRSDIRSSFGTGSATAEGVQLTLQFTVYDMANGNVPFEGVAVYAWHCTREGEYSMYGEGLESENFLRGVQIADADGVVSFTSVYPGCYSGRWPHVHFEVYPDEASITDSANAIATSQLAFPEDVCDTVYAEEGYESSVENLAQITLESDNIFSDDGGESQMGTVSGDVANGYTVALAVGVDTSTEAGGGGAAPSGGGGEPPSGEMPSGEPPSGEAPANNG